MSQAMHATRAYATAARARSWREQEADVFRLVNARLGAVRDGAADEVATTRALADCDRLWIMVSDLARDPANELPEELRASLASIGLAVRREVARRSPDLGFLIAVNEDLAAGLSGQG